MYLIKILQKIKIQKIKIQKNKCLFIENIKFNFKNKIKQYNT